MRTESGEKQIGILKAPEVLCLHLKRFKYGGMFESKNSKVVTFPVEENLDLEPFLLPESTDTSAEYQLMGIVQHMGSMGGGHYIA